MGAGDFMFDGQLRRQTLPALCRRPAAGEQAPVLRGGRTGRTNNFFKMIFGRRLEQERDDDQRQRVVFLPPQFNLRQPGGADAGMQNGFQPPAGRVAGKDQLRQQVAAKAAIGRNDGGPKAIPNFSQGGLAGLNQLAGDFVGVHDWHPVLNKESGGGGFAHPDAAGQTAKFHAVRSRPDHGTIELGRIIGGGEGVGKGNRVG